MSKIKITIDGKQVEAGAGERLLDVCRRFDIFIPTLCEHQDLKPYGVCRLCIVEWDRGDWSKIITSCNFPVKEGQVFKTSSDKVVRERKMIMEFTLARSSKTPEILALAKRVGVESSRFPAKDEGCILCGMCIRACSEVVEANAISFAERGPMRKISSPFFGEAGDCIGCGSCAYVCPTNYIEMTEDENTRSIPLWDVKFEMAKCKKCGQKIAPKKQIEFMKKKAKDIPEDWFDLCQNCR
ncbi:MAG: 2Fe-2S iron-sulfur cluster-binding protein [Pseudomonadota bacterium]